MADPESHSGSPPTITSSDALVQRTFNYIRDRDIVRAGDHLLVALSGGLDSSALILLLAHLRRRLKIQLTVAHFDHRLRSRAEPRRGTPSALPRDP